MKALDLALFVAVLLCPIAICTAAISTSAKRSILPPPPPPQPSNILLNRDDVEDHRNSLQDPVQKLTDKGGFTVVIDREFKAFDSDEETKFKRIMSDATNRYCSTADNCYGARKTVGPDDVVRYDLKAMDATSRTAVSFYVKNPNARTELAMKSEQLGKMVLAERTAIEAVLGYGLVLNEPDNTSDLPLYYWVITLALVIVLFTAVGAFVCCVHYRSAKRDSKRPIDDIEMRGYHTDSKTHPPGTAVPASVKRPTVDAETNVYQAEIIAETKTVILRPPLDETTPDANNELYAVVRKKTKEEKQQKMKRDEEKQRQKEQKDEPEDPSPNVIVVTAEISSSNEGSSHPEDNDDVAGSSSAEPPPAYHQVVNVENDDNVTKGADPDVPGTSEMPPSPPSEDNLPPPPSEDNLPPPPSEENLPPPPSEDDLPPPPTPDVESDSASSSSQELPPPPDECKATEDPLQDLKSSPPRRDSRTSSSPSSGKASSSAIKDVDEAVGELENLIADQSKEIADQGLDNAALDTIINEEGEPTTEL